MDKIPGWFAFCGTVNVGPFNSRDEAQAYIDTLRNRVGWQTEHRARIERNAAPAVHPEMTHRYFVGRETRNGGREGLEFLSSAYQQAKAQFHGWANAHETAAVVLRDGQFGEIVCMFAGRGDLLENLTRAKIPATYAQAPDAERRPGSPPTLAAPYGAKAVEYDVRLTLGERNAVMAAVRRVQAPYDAHREIDVAYLLNALAKLENAERAR